MTNLLVHIGAPKTGSSAIQHALSDARESLQGCGVCYANGLAGRSSHNEITDVVLRSPEKWGRSILRLFGPDDRDALRDTKGEQFVEELSSASKAIISAETFYSYSTSEIEGFIELCNNCGFDRILVVAYLREPTNLYLSQVQTILRGRSNFPSPFDFRVRYCRTLEKWAHQRSVDVLPFVYDNETDIVRHFGGLVTARLDENAGQLLRSRPNSNRSVSSEAMIFLEEYLTRFRDPGEDRLSDEIDRLIDVFSSLDKKAVVSQNRPRAMDWVINEIVRNNKEEICALRTKFALSFPTVPESVHSEETLQSGFESDPSLRDILRDWDPRILHELMLHSIHELSARI